MASAGTWEGDGKSAYGGAPDEAPLMARILAACLQKPLAIN